MTTAPDHEREASSLYPAIVREEPLAARVSTHLQRLIVENKLQQGGRLPSERYLAEQFGVSRTVIREAVRSLVAKGLLEVQAGSGTAIRAEPVASAAQSMGLLLSLGIRMGQLDLAKIVEVRRVLEVEIAALAAGRATPEDIALMQTILREAEQGIDDEDQFVGADIAFHAALAKATHNELFSVILSSISDILIEIRRVGWQTPGVASRAITHHRRVLECIEAGDPAGARQAMNEHMDEALDTLARGIGQDETAQP